MAFHLFDINELYSNAAGTVQFIEMAVGGSNGESQWQGQAITVTQGGTTHRFTFPSNLPSTLTANKTVLIATQGFADLGLVTPDFIVPDGFLFTSGSATVNFAGVDSVSYTSLPLDGRLSIDRSGATAVNSPKNFSGTAGSIVPVLPIEGTAGNDNLVGTTADEVVLGLAGNDTLNGLAGNDRLDGGADIDTALYAGARAAHTIGGSFAAGLTVSGPEGDDALVGVERVRFADRNLAFDLALGQSAGNTVRVIGAAFDAASIIPAYVGIGLGLFDSGQTMLQVCQLVVGTDLFRSMAGSSSNADFVNLVYRNVVGVAPTAEQRDFFVAQLQGSGGTMTQAELLKLAAEVPINETNVDLIGLTTSGVGFV